MNKEIRFSADARNLMAKGIETLNNATKVTLGPKGRNVIIEQDFGSPLIVNDGVTIAKAIKLKNKFENLGASILIEAATKTNDIVGDGTTSAILLSSNLILSGIEAVNKGHNPVLLRNGFNYYLGHILEMIEQVSTPVESEEDILKIATLSSGNPEIGAIITKAYSEVGKDGIITIEESQGLETYLDVVKGYSYDRGYLSPYMATDQEKMISVLDKPLILVTDKKINTMQEIMPFLEQSMKTTRPLLIICDDMSSEVLGAILVNMEVEYEVEIEEEVEVDYEVRVLEVALHTTPLESIAISKMEEEQMQQYLLYQETKGLLQEFASPLELDWEDDIFSCYGYRKHPSTKEPQLHRGLDIAVADGEKVYASCTGRVTTTGYDESYGNYIVIEDNRGFVIKYAPLEDIQVDVGQEVVVGDWIGTIGRMEHQTEPYLHLELIYGGEYYNPIFYFSTMQ